MAYPEWVRSGMRRRATAAAIVGTTIAFYDFFLYSSAVQLVFAPALARSGDPGVRWLIGASPFVGFVSRPVGAALFSRLGDRVGRKSALIWTLLAMAGPTALIGLVPVSADLWVAALLTAFRLLQGIGLGGEWAGSVLLAMEWQVDHDRRALAASLPQLGVPAGLVLGTGLLYLVRVLLPADQFALVGWRLPFLFSLLLAGFGLYIRLGVHETPVFTDLLERGRTVPRPLLEALRRHRGQIALSALLRVSADVGFYVFTSFAVVYLATRSPRAADRQTSLALVAVVIGSAVAVGAVPLAGALADRFGRKAVYGAGIGGLAVFAWPFFLLLDTGDRGLVVMAMVLALVLHSVQFGPQAAMIAESFPPQVRYSGASLSYQLAPVLAGAWVVPVATLLLQRSDSSLPIALFMVGCCAVSAVALHFLKPTRRYLYDVALSYASEDRAYVAGVADALRRRGVPLFYDRHQQRLLWGKDLAEHLRKVYGGQSRFVVLFVSRHYAVKTWTIEESRIAVARAIRQKGEECLLPARFDDTEIPGLSPTLAYVDCRRITPDRLASLIVQKLGHT